MTGTDVVKRTPAQELVAQVRTEEFKQQVALALPDNMPPQRFVRVMATALLDNPDLAAKATHASILNAGLKAAADGLLPDGREAAFVMFKPKDGQPQAVYMPMISGFRKIAAECGWSLRTAVVYAKDTFEHELGLAPKLIHRPTRPGMERGERIAAYAIAQHRDGRTEMEVMDADEIEKVRQTSRSKDYGPWADWPERMWEKTVGRRLFKKLPLDDRDRDRVERVLNVDELAPGEAARMLYGPPAGDGYEPVEGEIVDEGSSAQEESSGASEDGAPAADASEPDFEGPEPGDEPQAPAADKTVSGQVKFTSGKHEGKTIAAVAKDDPGYITGMLNKWKSEPVKSALHAYAQAAGLLPENLA